MDRLAVGTLALMMGCTDGKDSSPDVDPMDTGCDLTAYVTAACPTDPCPAISHADALVDLRTSMLAQIFNNGNVVCDATEAALTLDGTLLDTLSVEALEPGEAAVVFNDESVFTQTDTSLPATEHTFAVTVDEDMDQDELNDENNQIDTSFTPRTGVGCIVKGHFLEYIQEDLGITVSACTEEPFVDVKITNPYCGAITEAKNLGWVSGEVDTRDINSNENTTEIVYDTWTCASHAVAATILDRAYNLPSAGAACPDVDSAEWYAESMNAVQSATGILANPDGYCLPEEDLIRPKLEQLLGAL